MAGRIDSLDALRGLAALAVVFDHCLVTFAAMSATVFGHAHVNALADLLAYSPLHLLWAGHEAVILFFVLSGFVLALPCTGGASPAYGRFVVKRICRIYLPYAAAMAASAALLSLFAGPGGVPGRVAALSDWYNLMWSHPVTLDNLRDLAFMLGRWSFNYVTSAWSLVHELRISLIFPAIAWLAIRRPWQSNLGVALGVSLVFWWAEHRVAADPLVKSLCASGYYAAFFIVGASLAQARGRLIAWLGERSRLTTAVCAGVALLLYGWQWWPFAQTPWVRSYLVVDWMVALASALLIVLALGAPGVRAALDRRPLVALGRVSYSLYLVHPVVLLVCSRTLGPLIGLPGAVALVPAASLLVAFGFFQAVERPSQRLGRWLAGRVAAVRPTVRWEVGYRRP